jgi:hypothetical protein
MDTAHATDLEDHLRDPAISLVKQATGGITDSQIVEVLLETCRFLEISAQSKAPVVAVERDVQSETGTYHLFVRRLNSSIPAGKFQILITRDLASGLIC